MKNDFEMEVKKILKQAEKEMLELNHPYVGSEHMLLAVLKSNSNVTSILNNYGLFYDNFKENLIKIVGKSRIRSEVALYTPLLKRIISNSLDDAKERNTKVKTEYLILEMIEEGEGVGIRILLNMNISLDDLYESLNKPLKEYNNDLYLYNIGKILNNNLPDEKIFKREKEINNIIEILLRKNKNNPLLIGEAGVGKTAIVEELARKIDSSEVPSMLSSYKIVSLDTGSLISGTRYRGDFEERLNKIIKEAVNNKNIILFIDEIHTIVNCGGAEGAIDAANILKPYLARGDIKIIGATTNKEYKNTIYKDKALDRRFQTLYIEEPDLKDTIYILNSVKSDYEKHHNVIITSENIEDIVMYSDKYIFNKFNPDKALDILDLVCAHAKMTRPNNKNALSVLEKKKEKLLLQKKYNAVLELELKIHSLKENNDKIEITREDILKVIEYKTNMPVLDNFNKNLNNLKDLLLKKIYGQNEAVEKIVDLLKEKYLIDNRYPLSITLVGPSGCGKTFITKEIASILFGEKHFLHLNMKEFASDFAVSKLLGTSQGYIGYDDECILSKIKDYPYSIILLDDIEKASNKVKDIFEKIIEEGYVTTNKGETIHFENTTIIATSCKKVKNKVGFKTTNIKETKSTLFGDNIIYLNKIDKVSAKKYIKRESNNLKLTKDEIDSIIKKASIETLGMKGLQRELNHYKIKKMLANV